MQNTLATFRLLVLTAARNVVSHRMKSLIVGFILMFGTALLVVGTSLLDSVEASMQQTVTSSLAGHLQVYSAEADDKLALFGEVAFGGDDVGEIDDFSKIREPIEKLDNVRAVVPMGMTQARFVLGNRIDEVLDELRRAVRAQDWQKVDSLREQLEAMAEELRLENKNRAAIASNPERYRQNVEVLERALSDAFWDTELRQSPTEALLFLDTEIAPLASDGRLIFLRVLGTDLERFSTHFDRFEVVRGEMIPPGKHGLLVSNRTYERWLKNDIARDLDRIKEEIEEEERSLADDELLQNRVERLQKEYRRVTFGLPPNQVAEIKARVQDYLDSDSEDIKELLVEFLSLNEQNFYERYAFFYEHIAPLIEMYAFEVGDMITLQSFTDRGFARSANVKVYGTFQFQGMEDSKLAGSVNLVDLPTLRTLYGAMNEEARKELDQIRKEVGVEDVRRDDAEEALFGGGGDALVEEEPDALEEPPEDTESKGSDEAVSITINRPDDDTFDPTRIDRGLARNAAIILENPAKLEQTKAELERLIERDDLGLKVLDWQEAAGIVGQFVIVIRLALYVAIGIIFLVALVIINNSMVMATVERTSEIGTMRAIGAQRWYVMGLFLLETLILGAAAGLAGCGLGTLGVAIAGQVGIPASTDFLRFLFAGDYLYPSLSAWNVLSAFGLIVLVSTVSTVYPARLATRIQPIVAIRGGR